MPQINTDIKSIFFCSLCLLRAKQLITISNTYSNHSAQGQSVPENPQTGTCNPQL